jgi:hypothetical protein
MSGNRVEIAAVKFTAANRWRIGALASSRNKSPWFNEANQGQKVNLSNQPQLALQDGQMRH